MTFNGDKLEVVPSYKYLVLEFDCSYNWNSCVEKWIIGDMNTLYYMQNKCRKTHYGVEN
jgi:hypothetical protein